MGPTQHGISRNHLCNENEYYCFNKIENYHINNQHVVYPYYERRDRELLKTIPRVLEYPADK